MLGRCFLMLAGGSLQPCLTPLLYLIGSDSSPCIISILHVRLCIIMQLSLAGHQSFSKIAKRSPRFTQSKALELHRIL